MSEMVHYIIRWWNSIICCHLHRRFDGFLMYIVCYIFLSYSFYFRTVIFATHKLTFLLYHFLYKWQT